MEFENFLEFIYFNLIAISVNFHDQLVIVFCNSVLKDRVATPEPGPTRLASPNRNPGDARLKS